MLRIALINILIFVCFTGFAQHDDYKHSIVLYQDSLTFIQKNPETTQIIDEDFVNFEGLQFFEVDPHFRLKAKFVAEHDTHQFKLTYSDDPNVPMYVSSGTLFFTLEGVDYSLHVYQNVEWLDDPEKATHYFLPFKDWTNGPLSYGGGRFIDLTIHGEETEVILDFNKSYNPPCCYNYYMACPLIPECNHIEREITAGILTF